LVELFLFVDMPNLNPCSYRPFLKVLFARLLCVFWIRYFQKLFINGL